MNQVYVNIRGFRVPATEWSSGTVYVRGKDIASLCRKLLRAMEITAKSVRTDQYANGCSIEVVLPYWVSDSKLEHASRVLRSLSGSTFDGMIDLKETVEHTTDCGAKARFGADYIFVERDWRIPTPPPFTHHDKLGGAK